MALRMLKSFLITLADLSLDPIMRQLDVITSLLLIRAPNWRLPPGPLANWLPVFGSLPLFVIKPSYRMLARMAKKYGKVFRLKLGMSDFVVISDPDLIRVAFSTDALIGKSFFYLMEEEEYGETGRIDGGLMMSQRAFTARMMSNLTNPNHVMHKTFVVRASKAIRQLLRELDMSSGESVDVGLSFAFAITNIIFSTLVGTVFLRDDVELLLLITGTQHDTLRDKEVICFSNFLSQHAQRPAHQQAINAFWRRRGAFIFFMEGIVTRHLLDEWDPENPKDLIDAFLVEVNRPDMPANPFYTEPYLYSTLSHIFNISLNTLCTTIHWLLLAILKHPDIQEKIHDELDRVIGEFGSPTLGKMEAMPYLQATILEALRFATIMPIGLAHSAIKDITVGGYHIPKNATVVGLVWKVHRDPSLWKYDPNKFNPDNHLNDAGVLVMSPNLMTFSTGQRQCFWNQVALNTLFLIVANLFNMFRIRAKDSTALPSLDESADGYLRATLPFDITFVRKDLEHNVGFRGA